MSAHLAQVKNRSGQRVARIRIYMGTLTQGWPVPPRAKKKIRNTRTNNIWYHIFAIIKILQRSNRLRDRVVYACVRPLGSA